MDWVLVEIEIVALDYDRLRGMMRPWSRCDLHEKFGADVGIKILANHWCTVVLYVPLTWSCIIILVTIFS